MGWLSFHSRLITWITESFPERFGPRCLIDASHIVLYITTTLFQEGKTFFSFFLGGKFGVAAQSGARGQNRSNNCVTYAWWKRGCENVPMDRMKQWFTKSIKVCALLIALA